MGRVRLRLPAADCGRSSSGHTRGGSRRTVRAVGCLASKGRQKPRPREHSPWLLASRPREHRESPRTNAFSGRSHEAIFRRGDTLPDTSAVSTPAPRRGYWMYARSSGPRLENRRVSCSARCASSRTAQQWTDSRSRWIPRRWQDDSLIHLLHRGARGGLALR